MSKTARAPKPQGPNARLAEEVKRLVGRMEAAETALREHDGRLRKVEVVRTPSPTTTEPELPFNEQKPETE